MIKNRYIFLKKCIHGYFGTLLNVLVSSILVTFLGMNWPLIYRYIINNVFYEGNLSELYFVLVLYLVFFVAEKILQYIWKVSEAVLASDFLYAIKARIYEKVFRLELKERFRFNSGEILDILNNDVQQIYVFLVDEGVFAITCFIRLVMAIVYICYIDVMVAGVIIILTVVSYIISKCYKKKIAEVYKVFKSKNERYQGFVLDILTGLKEIKLFLANNFFINKFRKKTEVIFRLKGQLLIKEGERENVSLILNVVSEIVIYIAVAYGVVNNRIYLGDLVSLMIYFGWVKIFFSIFIQLFSGASKSFVSIDRIINLFDRRSEVIDGKKAPSGDIEFRNVSFSYDKGNVLNCISFKIEKGKMVALAGQSGSGKTTVINLLLKSYCPQNGSIYLDGVNLEEIDSSDLRGKIGIVNQDCKLYEGSIRENLLMGKSDAEEEEMWNALKVAQADDFVRDLPNGLDMIISNIDNLSAGQIQRVVLARAILRKPDILILDEATSNIDELNEAKIISRIQKMKRDTTVIMIAYRKKSLEVADKIYYIEKGQIMEEGTYAELCARSWKFKSLTYSNDLKNGEEL